MPGAVVALILLAGFALSGCDSFARRSSGAPASFILLLSVDTLRADHLGCYGYARPTSPSIDRLARDGILFERAFTSGGATLPTHMSMLTSLAYHAHDVNPGTNKRLDGERTTLAEALGSAGYRTAAFVGGGFVQARWGFDQGFGVFDEGKVTLARMLPGALEWIAGNRAARQFVFLHTLDVHSDKNRLPYEAPPPYGERFVRAGYSGSFDGCRAERCASTLLGWFNKAASRKEIDGRAFFTPEEIAYMVDLYDGGIAHADAEIGRLLERLRELGLYEQSLIVLTADHGEEFLEHGRLLHHQNYEEVARVPLLVKLPGRAHAGERLAGLVTTLDIMPTILAVAGVAAPPEMQGRSLLPMIEEGKPGRELVYIAGAAEKLRTERWSLLVGARGPRELYDLQADPGEQRNVLEEHRDVVADLHARYGSARDADRALGERLAAGGEPEKVELGEQTEQGLRALGYLQ